MISTLLSGLMAAAAAVAALPPVYQTYSVFPATVIGQGIVAGPISTTTTVVRTERKCHSRMVQIDPELDAKIRVPIPEETKATSKIRIIPLPCK